MNGPVLYQLLRCLLLVFSALTMMACQVQQPTVPVSQGPPVSGPVAAPGSRTVMTPGALLLTAAGQKRQLSAALLDAQDLPVQTAFTWTSSAPDLIRASADGSLEVLGSLGSAQLTAEAEGVRASILVVVVRPVSGAVLVSDAQIVGRPELLGDGPPALGSRYQVTSPTSRRSPAERQGGMSATPLLVRCQVRPVLQVGGTS